jgi:hypothetical protein
MTMFLLIANLEVKIISFILCVFNTNQKWNIMSHMYSYIKVSIIFNRNLRP